MKLTLPDGWVIDPIAALRLEHQLTTSPDLVRSVLAPLVPLPPGASYRTLAEHLALLPLDAIRRHPSSAERPPGASVERGPAGSDLSSVLLVDTGTATHDPSAVGREVRVASPIGRSPFPRRPVVAFVGVDPPEPILDRAHSLTDALVHLDVEARLVVRRHPDGSHLTRPCLADLRSLQILRPQVLVVLDAEGGELAEAWCRQSRATTIVDLDPTATAAVALRLGPVPAPSRAHRASIHPDAAPEELARLFGRLTAGPQPGSPTSVSLRSPVTTASARVHRRPTTIRTVGLWAGVLDRAGRERFDGLATQLELGGDRALWSEGDGVPSAFERVDVLVLRGMAASRDLVDLLDRRQASARPTIIDLGADDLGAAEASFGLSTDTLALVEASRLVSTPSGGWCTELRAAGFAAHRLPTLHPPGNTLPVERVPAPLADPATTITWVLDPMGPPPASATAVEQALRSLLGDRSDIRVVLCGDPRRWPASLASDAETNLRASGPDAALIGESTLFLWTPDRRLASASGPPLWLLRAAERGIPTLVDQTGPDGTGGLVTPDTTVDRPEDPEGWRTTMEWLLDDDLAFRWVRHETRRRARGVVATEHSQRELDTFLSWALAQAHAFDEGDGRS